MSTYPLIIDLQARALISVAVADGLKNAISYERMKARADAFERGEPVSSNIEHTVQIPMSYSATYTVEEHQPGIPFRHLSVSIIDGKPGRGPHPMVMDELMREFGFQCSREEAAGWLENLEDGRIAINVLEPLSGWAAVEPERMTA
jgi:hypothetical protein